MRLRYPLAAAAVGLVASTAWLLWKAERAEVEAVDPPVASADATPPAASAPAPATAPPRIAETLELRRADTLVAALVRHGLTAAEANALAGGLRAAGADLRRMRTGDRIELARDGVAGTIVGAAYAPSAWQRFVGNAEANGWRFERTDVAAEVRAEVREGTVRNSLWDAVDAGIIGAQAILDLVQIFESEFDFTADTRPGDRFRVLVEARYADGVHVEDGRILAAQYVAEDTTMTGVAFEVDGRTNYYDAQGRSLKKMFLRSPLQFSRISSGFTYRRPHPVLGGVRPHLAIDYAAPTGTPVWAVAAGSVEFAGRKGGNGIQVLLRHRAGYKTYYNHLSRVAKGVRAGARVAQKQLIGYVGSTGLSTGPHLDYRVSRNGVFVNPLNEKFLPGEPVPAGRREAFAQHARDLLARLEAADAAAAPAAVPAEASAGAPRS